MEGLLLLFVTVIVDDTVLFLQQAKSSTFTETKSESRRMRQNVTLDNNQGIHK
jgi:hypothetical protein